MATPYVLLSTPYQPILQTQDYRSLSASDEAMSNPVSAAYLDFSWLMDARQQLREIHKEVTDMNVPPNEKLTRFISSKSGFSIANKRITSFLFFITKKNH